MHLDGHLVVLVARLGAGVLLVGVLGAAAVVEDGDLAEQGEARRRRRGGARRRSGERE